MKQQNPPDWSCITQVMGGNGWSSDCVRFFPTPDGKKRKVRVSFASYAGIVPGATHTYAELKPEKNLVWDGECWADLWDDPEHNEHSQSHHTQRFVDPARALRWAVRTLQLEFPETEWEYEWPGCYYDDNDQPLPSQWDPNSVMPDVAEDAAVMPCPVCKHVLGEHNDTELALCQQEVIVHTLVTPPSLSDVPVVRVLVDAGCVFGTVGDDVFVLTSMYPSDSNISLLQKARGLIVERGGATSHLADLARELRVTVVLVEDASCRYQDGMTVDIDPVSNTVVVVA